jgi:NAD(P)-dependent dehydrogenase (short-subunit alcohol dehydrogenase family)
MDEVSAQRTIGVRRFTPADQLAFARLSGDHNPIHLDDLAARRTQAGAVVVHGVHGMMWALDQAARVRSLTGLNAISARFNRFVFLDTETQLRLREQGDALVAEVLVDGQAATTVKMNWGPDQPEALSAALSGAPPHQLGLEPLAPPFETMRDLSGRLAIGSDGLAQQMFPALSNALGAEAVAAMALITGVVGMSCPGLHSLFSQVTLRRVAGLSGPSVLGWRVAKTDARTRWVQLEVGGAGWEGEVLTLARQPPVETPSMPQLCSRIDRAEFSGRTALIIGGSRGLGAVTGKLLAAGGARVILTYARGRRDAEAVVEEILAARGPLSGAALHCDVLGDVAAQLKDVPETITHLYYFATPRIGRQGSKVYDRETLDQFLAVYVHGFAAVWDALAARRPLSVFYPSTVFIQERPKGMTEYAMAKLAAEALCADLARSAPGVSISAPRLPRILTDQTATTPPVPADDPVEAMLPLLRAQA